LQKEYFENNTSFEHTFFYRRCMISEYIWTRRYVHKTIHLLSRFVKYARDNSNALFRKRRQHVHKPEDEGNAIDDQPVVHVAKTSGAVFATYAIERARPCVRDTRTLSACAAVAVPTWSRHRRVGVPHSTPTTMTVPVLAANTITSRESRRPNRPRRVRRIVSWLGELGTNAHVLEPFEYYRCRSVDVRTGSRLTHGVRKTKPPWRLSRAVADDRRSYPCSDNLASQTPRARKLSPRASCPPCPWHGSLFRASVRFVPEAEANKVRLGPSTFRRAAWR